MTIRSIPSPPHERREELGVTLVDPHLSIHPARITSQLPPAPLQPTHPHTHSHRRSYQYIRTSFRWWVGEMGKGSETVGFGTSSSSVLHTPRLGTSQQRIQVQSNGQSNLHVVETHSEFPLSHKLPTTTILAPTATLDNSTPIHHTLEGAHGGMVMGRVGDEHPLMPSHLLHHLPPPAHPHNHIHCALRRLDVDAVGGGEGEGEERIGGLQFGCLERAARRRRTHRMKERHGWR